MADTTAQKVIEARQAKSIAEVGYVDLLTWTIVHRRLLAPSRPFNLSNHRFLAGIYSDDCEHMVLCKAGQVGISEYLISWIIWSADERKATGLYVMPTDTHVSDFSAARLGPGIEEDTSPYLSSIIVSASGKNQRGADRVGLKRVRNRFIYFRGAKVKIDGRAPQLRSIDADVLVLDEFDEMDRQAPALAMERLGHSLIHQVRVASTPTFTKQGIHKEFLASDQRHWFVRCSKCGKFQDMTINDVVTQWDDLGRPVKWNADKEGQPFIKCRKPKCGGALDRLGDGEWVATYPRRLIHGYHVSRLFVVHKPLIHVVNSLKTVDETERQQAFNQGLGLPYRSPSSVSLGPEVLDECCRRYGLKGKFKAKGKLFMGVDIGRVIHVVIREVRKNGGTVARYIGEVPSFDEVARLMKLYKVTTCVVDALPETRKAREFQHEFQSHEVWLAYYTAQKVGSKKDPPENWDPRENVVNLDRTRTLDETFGGFISASQKEPGSTLPANAKDIPDYYDQMCALERIFREGADGNKIPIYVESEPDHYAHAENYCSVAQNCPMAKSWVRGAS